jgi:hypothetical protein
MISCAINLPNLDEDFPTMSTTVKTTDLKTKERREGKGKKKRLVAFFFFFSLGAL